MNSTTRSGHNIDWENEQPGQDALSRKDASAPPAGASAAAASYFEMLEAVDAFVSRADFARVSKFVTPFTRQFKESIAAGYPTDAQLYHEIEDLQKGATKLYRSLRVTTAFLFVLFLAAADAFPYAIRHFSRYVAMPWWASLAVIACIALLGVTLASSRLGLRKHFLDFRIDHIVKELASTVSQKFAKLVTDTNAACSQIDARSDFGTGQLWTERAYGWIRIALWLAMRCIGLDHYVTTAFWKMQVTDTYTERFFRLLKGILLVIALGILFDAYRPAGSDWLLGELSCLAAGLLLWAAAWYFLFVRHGKRLRRKWNRDFWALFGVYAVAAGFWLGVHPSPQTAWPPAVLGAVLVIAFWFGWIVAGERDDQELVDIFTKKINKISPPNTAHFFNPISSRVKNLVAEIIDAQRSGRGSPSSTS